MLQIEAINIARLKIVFIFILFLFLLNCSDTPPKSPLSENALNKINEELKEWADGRWASFEASYDTKNSTLIIQITAMPQSNSTAWNGYCKALKDLANKYANGYNFVGRVYVLGEVKKRCF